MFADLKSSRPAAAQSSIWLRRICRVTAFTLVTLLAAEAIPAPVYADSATAVGGYVRTQSAIVEHQMRSYEIMQALRAKMAAVTPANFVEMAQPQNLQLGVSVIDEIGRLSRPIADSYPTTWRQQLEKAPAESKWTASQRDYYAQRHLWLGQYELAVQKHPQLAIREFRTAYHMTDARDEIDGTALYDEALSVYYEHNFVQSVEFYRHILRVRPIPNGFDRSDASLMLRHAMACLGYHEGNARLGIPEPPVLDPYCGAASLAASLRSLGLKYDRDTVVANCRVTGEGSDLQDLIDAGRHLGASVYPVSADDRGLIAMPKPAIAFVEQDHFVSVVRADKAGRLLPLLRLRHVAGRSGRPDLETVARPVAGHLRRRREARQSVGSVSAEAGPDEVLGAGADAVRHGRNPKRCGERSSGLRSAVGRNPATGVAHVAHAPDRSADDPPCDLSPRYAKRKLRKLCGRSTLLSRLPNRRRWSRGRQLSERGQRQRRTSASGFCIIGAVSWRSCRPCNGRGGI